MANPSTSVLILTKTMESFDEDNESLKSSDSKSQEVEDRTELTYQSNYESAACSGAPPRQFESAPCLETETIFCYLSRKSFVGIRNLKRFYHFSVIILSHIILYPKLF